MTEGFRRAARAFASAGDQIQAADQFIALRQGRPFQLQRIVLHPGWLGEHHDRPPAPCGSQPGVPSVTNGPGRRACPPPAPRADPGPAPSATPGSPSASKKNRDIEAVERQAARLAGSAQSAEVEP